MLNAVFAVPQQQGPQPLIVTPPPGGGAVTSGSLDGFLSNVNSLAGLARNVQGTWGEIQDLGGQDDPPPQPAQNQVHRGEEMPEAPSFLGLSIVSLVAGGIVAVVGWALGWNLAWTLVAAIAAAILVPYVMA